MNQLEVDRNIALLNRATGLLGQHQTGRRFGHGRSEGVGDVRESTRLGQQEETRAGIRPTSRKGIQSSYGHEFLLARQPLYPL